MKWSGSCFRDGILCVFSVSFFEIGIRADWYLRWQLRFFDLMASERNARAVGRGHLPGFVVAVLIDSDPLIPIWSPVLPETVGKHPNNAPWISIIGRLVYRFRILV
jgi:hypothetical protein